VIKVSAEVMMDKLHLGVEIRDFDLERLGFSLSVLPEANRHPLSEGYLRMTLAEMNAFLKALRAADETVDVSTFETAAKRRPTSPSHEPPRVPPAEDAALAYSLRR
jgi:hypothetical protein